MREKIDEAIEAYVDAKRVEVSNWYEIRLQEVKQKAREENATLYFRLDEAIMESRKWAWRACVLVAIALAESLIIIAYLIRDSAS